MYSDQYGEFACGYLGLKGERLCQSLLRYTYGKPVIGTAVVNLAIAGRNGTSVPFAKHAIVVSFSVLLICSVLQLTDTVTSHGV